MTCIVGYIHKGVVYLGFDSHMNAGWTQGVPPPKVFSVASPHRILVGCAGDIRLANIIRYGLSFTPEQSAQSPDERWMHTVFVDAVRQAATAGGYTITHEGRVSLGQNNLLIATLGKLYSLHDDFCLIPITRPYHAVGSGGMVAMGALFQMEQDQALTPESRVLQALTAAAGLAISVAAPFHIECLQMPSDTTTDASYLYWYDAGKDRFHPRHQPMGIYLTLENEYPRDEMALQAFMLGWQAKKEVQSNG
jgi:hypothetical protein